MATWHLRRYQKLSQLFKTSQTLCEHFFE